MNVKIEIKFYLLKIFIINIIYYSNYINVIYLEKEFCNYYVWFKILC